MASLNRVQRLFLRGATHWSVLTRREAQSTIKFIQNITGIIVAQNQRNGLACSRPQIRILLPQPCYILVIALGRNYHHKYTWLSPHLGRWR
jgi:hypothetical protein